MNQEQFKIWVFGLMERADKVSKMLDKPTIPSIEVAELTGYAKSSLSLLSDKQRAEYRHEYPTPPTKEKGE